MSRRSSIKQVEGFMVGDRVFSTREPAVQLSAELKLRDLMRSKGVARGGEWDDEMFLGFLHDNAAEVSRLLRMIADPKPEDEP